MRRMGMRGMALLSLLTALFVIAVLASAALPLGLSLYARAAVEYEAMHLIGDLRRMQALSRTTAMPLYVLGGTPSWERGPRVRIQSEQYALHHPFQEERNHVHQLLPLVRLTQETMKDTPVVFDSNGDIQGHWSHNMKIRVYAEGYEKDALYVVIDRAARIRLQRGTRGAADEED